MLARVNRVTRPADFRTVVRKGRRVGSTNTVVHVIDHANSDPSRFGFIVTKAVGNAVTRNLVRRRLRAASRDILESVGDGRDVVIRALPGSDRVTWVTLHAEIAESIARSVSTR